MKLWQVAPFFSLTFGEVCNLKREDAKLPLLFSIYKPHQKWVKKGATCQSFIRKEITCYRIGTLDQFAKQNTISMIISCALSIAKIPWKGHSNNPCKKICIVWAPQMETCGTIMPINEPLALIRGSHLMLLHASRNSNGYKIPQFWGCKNQKIKISHCELVFLLIWKAELILQVNHKHLDGLVVGQHLLEWFD